MSTSENYSYSYMIKTGLLFDNPGAIWHVSQGQLPPNSTFSTNGLLTVNFQESIIPFAKKNFLDYDNPIDLPTLSDTFWDEYLKELMEEAHDYDYQFAVSLINPNGLIIVTHTMRVVHLRPPRYSSWFMLNNDYLKYDPNQLYYYLSSSEDEHVVWHTPAGFLGNIVNGQISQLSVSAAITNNQPPVIEFKPDPSIRFPHGLQLQADGIISGRTSFRCHIDDPINIPSDLYEFILRAYSPSRASFAERNFSIQIIRVNQHPAENIWINAYPYIKERLYFQEIMDDPILFPTESLYRPTDPWFGKANRIRVLFAPGLNLVSPANYEQILSSNHYDKKLIFGEVKTAVCLNDSLNIEYEVVYLTLLDEMMAFDPITQLYNRSLKRTIDLQDHIQNYYLDDGIAYYILKPNSLKNMKEIIDEEVGQFSSGFIPNWMSSLQPIEGRPGFFSSPIGFQPVVVLAYCLPGASSAIAHRLKDINFNRISFEFDRYQLESKMSEFYDTVGNVFSAGVLTSLDSSNTLFDANNTRIIEHYDSYGVPEQGDKYLKFPKTKVFK